MNTDWPCLPSLTSEPCLVLTLADACERPVDFAPGKAGAKSNTKIAPRRKKCSEPFPALEWISKPRPRPPLLSGREHIIRSFPSAWCRHGACGSQPGSGAEHLHHLGPFSCGRFDTKKRKGLARPISPAVRNAHRCTDTHARTAACRDGRECAARGAAKRQRFYEPVRANDMLSHAGKMTCRYGMVTFYCVVLQVGYTTLSVLFCFSA